MVLKAVSLTAFNTISDSEVVWKNYTLSGDNLKHMHWQFNCHSDNHCHVCLKKYMQIVIQNMFVDNRCISVKVYINLDIAHSHNNTMLHTCGAVHEMASRPIRLDFGLS